MKVHLLVKSFSDVCVRVCEGCQIIQTCSTDDEKRVFIFISILRSVDHCTSDPSGIYLRCFFSSFPVSKICSNFITNIASGARKGRLISASISLIASGIIEGNIIDFWSAACIKLQWRDAAPCAILLCYYLPLQSPGRSPRASRWGGERDVISVIASSPLIAFGAPLYTPPPFKLPRVIPPSPLQYVVIKVHGLNIKTLTSEGNNTAVSNT